MKVNVEWLDAVSFKASTESGHDVIMDGSAELGGQDKGARPMEMVLVGLGGCASIDLVHILKKARQQITTCRVEISADRADAVPAVFTKIHLHFTVEGEALKSAQVERAVKLSAEKYCSVSAMLLDGGVETTHSFSLDHEHPNFNGSER